jgi:hypothetical protein
LQIANRAALIWQAIDRTSRLAISVLSNYEQFDTAPFKGLASPTSHLAPDAPSDGMTNQSGDDGKTELLDLLKEKVTWEFDLLPGTG